MERDKLSPTPLEPKRNDDLDSGPKVPDVQRPDRKDILERMKRVDPNTAKRYRQRSGE